MSSLGWLPFTNLDQYRILSFAMFSLPSSRYVRIIVLLSIGVFRSLAFDCEKDIEFQLYTPSQVVSLKPSGTPSISSTGFDPHRPTRIFIHGYNSYQQLIDEFRAAYRDLGFYNFIGVGKIQFFYHFKFYTKLRTDANKIIHSLQFCRLACGCMHVQLFVREITRSTGKFEIILFKSSTY